MHESRMRRWGTAGCHLWHLPVHTVLTKHVSSYGRRTGGCGAPVPDSFSLAVILCRSCCGVPRLSLMCTNMLCSGLMYFSDSKARP